MKIQTVPRCQDTRLVAMLRLRTAGMTGKDIGERMGLSPEAVLGQTNRIMQADLAESGESEAVVRAGYWPKSNKARRG